MIHSFNTSINVYLKISSSWTMDNTIQDISISRFLNSQLTSSRKWITHTTRWNTVHLLRSSLSSFLTSRISPVHLNLQSLVLAPLSKRRTIESTVSSYQSYRCSNISTSSFKDFSPDRRRRGETADREPLSYILILIRPSSPSLYLATTPRR